MDFAWRELGSLELDAAGRLGFPTAPQGPGLYEFWIETADDRPGVYIGESVNLRRRFQAYRTPGSKQVTNQRMSAWLIKALRSGARIGVRIVTSASVQWDADEPQALDMTRKNQRLVAEQAAIAWAFLVEDFAPNDEGAVRPQVLNRPGVGEADYE